MRTMDESLVTLGMKEHPAGSKKLDQEALDDPALVSSVEGRLANLHMLTGQTAGKNPAALDVDDDDDSTPDDDDTDVVDDAVDDDDQAVSDDDDDDDSTPAGKKGEEEVGIPDAYVRAAIHSGWKEKDIEGLLKANPEMAAKTFENLYNSTNKASREWAAIGRASRKDATQELESKKADKLEFSGVDIAALKKEFDIDPVIEKIFEGSNANNHKLVDALNQLMETQPAQQDNRRAIQSAKSYDVATEAAREQQINGFFATDSMKPYGKFYGELKFGESWEQLPPGQQRSRFAVYQTADQLLAGATMQAQPMELTEALERAHLLVTEGMREEVDRSEIKGTATKRKNSMVFRPSDGKSKTVSEGGKPRTKNELERKVARGLRKAGLMSR